MPLLCKLRFSIYFSLKMPSIFSFQYLLAFLTDFRFRSCSLSSVMSILLLCYDSFFLMINMFSDASVFQWNYRGLRCKLPNFRQCLRQSPFPVLALSEHGVGNSFRLAGYQPFYSQWHQGKSRALLAVRSDCTYIEHHVPPDDTNKLCLCDC